jgi:carboxypeptidase Taq
MTALQQLKDRLESAAALLGWDQRTYMPRGAAAARAAQIGTVLRLAHEQFTDPAVGRRASGSVSGCVRAER